ncbi:glycine--tRNA ligase subunit beta [Bacillus altitudinis]|uniref:glycine--tRNA ligase subunit beta n=1 Tax=Bacillus altitudinis TaxID=293387 RepID=UPI001EEDF8D1|nr:glycine--tRNA ligase subunit beta [Bacillus altitudinis]
MGADEERCKGAGRGGSICKFDVVSEMVYELGEVEGMMGEKYGRGVGEDEEVGKSMKEEYMGGFAGEDAGSRVIGGIVAVGDKVDSIC